MTSTEVKLNFIHIFHFFSTGIEASPEELLKLLTGNPNQFTKCSFRVDTSTRPVRYCGHLPTPDGPDIKIPGRVRGVYEDDVVVLELLSDVRARDEEGQRKETAVVGHIKGERHFIFLRLNKKLNYCCTTRE